jgi:hypothetical protein
VRPPLLSEQMIRAAIRELAGREQRITGVAVRELLSARYGARGGVTRIYRVLNAARADDRDRSDRPLDAAQLIPSSESREAAIARADLAEHRERAHQERWARETDALRARLAVAEAASRDAEASKRRIVELARALASAQARIAHLELMPRDDE